MFVTPRCPRKIPCFFGRSVTARAIPRAASLIEWRLSPFKARAAPDKGYEAFDELPKLVLCRIACEPAGSVEDAPGTGHEKASAVPRRRPVPKVRRTGSHAFWLRTVPKPPGDAPSTATGFPPKTLPMSAGGRESQSIAFLNVPGIELLYSGVARSIPSAATIASFSAATRSGIPSAVSTSAS